MKKVMLVFGTRPEAIKMCPLVNELKSAARNYRRLSALRVSIVEMLDMVLRGVQRYAGLRPVNHEGQTDAV